MISTLIVVAQTSCNRAPCNVCIGVDPDSWEWIFKGCWMVGSPAVASFGVGLVMALMVLAMHWSAPKTK